MSNYSTVNPGRVVFSEGSRVLIGAIGAEKGACTPVGLLGADVTLGIEKTFRTKNDHFPEVPVAQAVQSLSLTANIILREWTKQNLMYALDVANSDVTDVPASAVNVVDEPYTVPATGQLSVAIPRTGLTNIVVKEAPSTTLTLNTDYVVVVTQGQTLIVALSGGAIIAEDALLISYDYTPLAHSHMPLGHSGQRNGYAVWFEEKLTGSATQRVDYRVYKAFLGIDGEFNLNNAESGGDLPILIEGALDAGRSELGRVYNYS